MELGSEVGVLLRDSATNVQAWFETQNLLPADDVATSFLEHQTWTSAIHLARATDPLIHYCLNVVSNLIRDDEEPISELMHLELGAVCMSGWVGARSSREADVVVGLVAQIRRWMQDWQLGTRLRRDVKINAIVPTSPTMHVKIRPQAIAYVTMAGLDLYTAELREDSYRLKLVRIRSALGINAPELAKLLHVSREAVRKWDLGETISPERWSDIDQLYSDTEKLLGFIRPERLPAVVRRRIPVLNDQTPLELLASRRSNELLTLYDNLTSYQTTA